MTDIDSKQLVVERSRILQKTRRKLLAIPPEKAMQAILDDKHALEIVHSFPHEDFYFLIHDIGVEDALPLLSLASNNQWEYLLDVEIWHKDRLDIVSATEWLNLLLHADPKRLAHWCTKQKTEFLELFLFHNVEVRVRDHDQSPGDLEDDFISYDDTFYFRILEPPLHIIADDNSFDQLKSERYRKDRLKFFGTLMQRLSESDHRFFQNILLESMSIIPAEAEEEAYRLRNVRLAEKGFLPFEEAIGIYQPLSSRDIHRRGAKHLIAGADTSVILPAPLYSNNLVKQDNTFARALAAIDNQNILMQLQSEFAGLCNQLIMADQKIIKEREGLRETVKKACGYISIGLEEIAEEPISLVRKYLLADIFRVGYGLLMQLKRKTENWRTKSWFAAEGLPLSFWGEHWLGIIGGLLIKRPLYFDNYQSGVLYREFAGSEDILKTKRALDDVIAFDYLLSRLRLKMKPLQAYSLLTYQNLVLTLWSRYYLEIDNQTAEVAAISFESFKEFYNDLWDTPKTPHKIDLPIKKSFLVWLSKTSGLSGSEITAQYGAILDSLFLEIESEYRDVTSKDLDPRFIHLFLISK
jgi:hypothetical protein